MSDEGGGALSATTAREAKPRRIHAAFVPVAIFAAMAVVFMFALRTAEPSKLPSMLIGKHAPTLTLPPLEGLTENNVAVPGIANNDLSRGKPVIVNFWASWCGPCVAEHPLLIILQEQSGAPLIGINYKDSATNARRFLNRYGNPFAAVGVDSNGRAGIEWGVYGMPETFILNGQGTVIYKHVGPLTPDIIEQKLLPMIKAAQ